MTDDRRSGAPGVILAFLMGGLTGAALAMLFAPRSGRETRDLLGETFRDSAEKTRGIKERAVARGRETWRTHPSTWSARGNPWSGVRTGSPPRSRPGARP